MDRILPVCSVLGFLLLVGVSVVIGWRARTQLRQMQELRAAWASCEEAYLALVNEAQELAGCESLLDELAGSWSCPLDAGALLREVAERSSASLEIGKLRIDSRLSYGDADGQDATSPVPLHQYEAELAARFYGEDAQQNILTFRDELAASEAVRSVFDRLQLQGLKRIDAQPHRHASAHTVFSIYFTGPPHPMQIGPASP